MLRREEYRPQELSGQHKKLLGALAGRSRRVLRSLDRRASLARRETPAMLGARQDELLAASEGRTLAITVQAFAMSGMQHAENLGVISGKRMARLTEAYEYRLAIAA